MSDTALRDLLAKQEIYESIVRYCRGTDRHDRDLIADQYHPDGIDDHGVERTGAEWADTVMQFEFERTTWVHHVGQVLVELHGDHAFVETHWVAYRAGDDEGERFLRSRGGRYADWFEKRDGRWKVRVRRVVDDWSTIETVDRVIDDGALPGRPFPDDPIYTMQHDVRAHVGSLTER